MELSNYDEKHVRVTDVLGNTYTGIVDFFCSDYCMHEYNREADSIIIGGYILPVSSIVSIEEIEVHGTVELRTERLILRRYCPEDAPALYKEFGMDPAMVQYSGWNPYETLEMAQETVCRYIAGYEDERFYGWVMDFEGVLLGTIGAYDYKNGCIEVGFSVVKACWGRGYATEALKVVLEYLTQNEGISCVTAWCASDNIGSRRALEKAGMKIVSTEKGGLAVGDRVYDKMNYEYRRQGARCAKYD